MKALLQLFHADQSDSRSSLLAHGFLLTQLLLLTYLVREYQLEPTLHLYELLLLVCGGFALQPLIPIALRTHFFLLLSLAGLVIFVGWINALAVMAIGLTLVLLAIYIKPDLPRYLAIGTLSAALIFLVATKKEWLGDHFVALSTLGAMFMFRLSIFLYDKQHQKESPGLIQDLSYFFLLPNMAILLFPAVDYQTFLKRQWNERDVRIYKKGTQWLVMGIFHLVVYRIFYYYFLTPVSEVTDFYSFGKYALVNYALIIRLSGVFHTSVGILCLFGFNLPPVFNNYFLASGFSDLWRRINIYFREYLIKVFYYPIFFRIRHWGNTQAVVVTILILFFITWMLHSFQWFWIKGKFPLRLVDLVFWGIFGVLVAANAVLDMRKSRQVNTPSPWRISATASAQMVGMFVFMSLLWSLWTPNTLAEWLAPVRTALQSPPEQFLVGAGLLVLIWAVATMIHRGIAASGWGDYINPDPATKMASFWSLAMLGGLLLLQQPQLENLSRQWANIELDGVRTAKLNKADEHLMIEGYYTEILVGNELTNPLGEMATPQREQFRFTEGAKTVADFREIVQKPNTRFLFKGKPYTINQFGMRDKEYTLAKPANTLRIGLLGGSFVCGSGVGDADVFDTWLEDELNKGSDEKRYELLNFSSSGFDLIDCIVRFDEESIAQFEPDYLIYFSHGVDMQKNIRDLINALKKDVAIPYPYLEDIIQRSGVNKDMNEFEMMKLLRPFGEEILSKSYQLLYDRCRDHGIEPVWAFWPTIGLRPTMHLEKELILPMVEKIGYRIIDLEEVYADENPDSLYVSRSDRHPNERGQRLVAAWLYRHFTNGFFDQPEK